MRLELKYRIFKVTEKYDPDTFDDYQVPVSAFSNLFDEEHEAVDVILKYGDENVNYIILPVYIKRWI